MNKKRNKPKALDSIWEFCLEMWKSVSLVYELGSTTPVSSVKEKWLEMKGFDPDDIVSGCFFCDWAKRKGQSSFFPDRRGGCKKCPGVKVSEKFACQLKGTTWHKDPVKFYQLLVKLDKKRTPNRKKKRLIVISY
jgi:hypothetical protein